MDSMKFDQAGWPFKHAGCGELVRPRTLFAPGFLFGPDFGDVRIQAFWPGVGFLGFSGTAPTRACEQLTRAELLSGKSR